MDIKKHLGIWLAFVIGGTVVVALKLILVPGTHIGYYSGMMNNTNSTSSELSARIISKRKSEREHNNEWDAILRDKEFQSQPLEVKKRVAENFFRREIASDPEFRQQTPDIQDKVKANFMKTLDTGYEY